MHTAPTLQGEQIGRGGREGTGWTAGHAEEDSKDG